MFNAILPSSISELRAKSPCSASVFGFRVVWMLRIQITESRMLGAKRPERSGFASIRMRSIRITEDKGAKRPSDQSETKASGYGIVTGFRVSVWNYTSMLSFYPKIKPILHQL